MAKTKNSKLLIVDAQEEGSIKLWFFSEKYCLTLKEIIIN